MRLISLMLLSLFVLSSCAVQQDATKGNSTSSNTSDVGINPEAAAINIRLAANYISSQNYVLADEKLLRAFKQDPKSSVARWTYAILQEKLEQVDQAEFYYKKAIALNAKDSQGRHNYASFLCRHQRYKEADEHFKITLQDPLYKARARVNLAAGICAMEIPDYGLAEGYFNESLRLSPNNRVALYQLAKLNFLRGDIAFAQSHMRDFEGLSTHTAESLWLAYRIERRLGNAKIARSYSTQLLNTFPDSQQARNLARDQ